MHHIHSENKKPQAYKECLKTLAFSGVFVLFVYEAPRQIQSHGSSLLIYPRQLRILSSTVGLDEIPRIQIYEELSEF